MADLDPPQDEVDGIVAAWRHERPDLDVEPLQVLSRLDRLAGVLGERRAAIFARHDRAATNSTYWPRCAAPANPSSSLRASSRRVRTSPRAR